MSRLKLGGMVALVVVLGALTLAAGALAGGLDHGYGKNGIATIAPPLPQGFEPVDSEMAVASGGAVYDLRAASRCPKGGCPINYFLYRFRSNGKRDHGFGRGGVLALGQYAPSIHLWLDGKGRPVVTQYAETRIERFTRGGRADGSFGDGGTVALGRRQTISKILPAPGGGLYAVGEREFARGEYGPGFTELEIARLRSNGLLDRRFGHGGYATATLAGQSGRLTATPKGGILAAEPSESGLSLSLISPRGRLDTRFDANARATLRGFSSLGVQPLALPLFGRGVEILGFTEAEGGYALRLGADGRLDQRFGQGGRQALAFDPVAAAAVAGGVFAVSESEESKVSVVRLGSDGLSDPGFNGGSPLAIPAPGGNRLTVTSIGRNGVIVTSAGDRRCPEGCTRTPYAARLIESRPAVA
jgi:hypothetical protein